MTQDEALKKTQNEIWNKGPFFQSEMAQYAVQLGFEKGAEWKEQQIIEWLKNHLNDYLVKGRDIDYIFEDLLKINS